VTNRPETSEEITLRIDRQGFISIQLSEARRRYHKILLRVMYIYINKNFLMSASVAAVILLVSVQFPIFKFLAIPFCWPSFFIIGVDETTEKYGASGELLLTWLSSLPWIWLCSLAFSRWNRHKAKQLSLRKSNFDVNSECS
jgi:hypothetical protein